MGQRRATRFLLEVIPRGEPRFRLRDEESIDQSGLFHTQRGLHLLVELSVDDAPGMACPLNHGVEGRQLIFFSHQLFNAHVDEVGQFIFGFGCLSHGCQHGVTCFLPITLDLENLSNNVSVTFAGSRKIIVRKSSKSERSLGESGNMLNNGDWYLVGWYHISQTLKGL